MPARTYQCTRCEKEFKSGQWLGCSDNNVLEHTVAAKTYFSQNGSLAVNIMCDRVIMDNGGNKISVPGKAANFIGGQFITDDPQTQEVLDTKTYLLTNAQYTEINTPTELKNARLKGELVEKNALLDRAKQEADELRAKLKAKEAEEPELAGTRKRS